MEATITVNDPIPQVQKISDAEKARQMKRDDPSLTSKEIAERIGRKVTYVYAALRFAKDIPHPKRGRPRKTVRSAPIKQEPKVVTQDMLNQAAIRVREDQIAELEKKIADLKVVICYLENRIYGTSV